MSEFADKVLGFTYFFFLFIILGFCLYRTLSGQYGDWAILCFFANAACGFAWLTMTVMFTAFCQVFRITIPIVSIAIFTIILNRNKMPGNDSGLVRLIFMLCALYFWTASVVI